MENYFKKFYNFLKKDTWTSLIVTLILAFLVIKFIFFPILSLITGNSLPLVIVESCSMNHQGLLGGSFDSYWTEKGSWYEQRGITKEQFKEFSFTSGMKMGDIILVYNKSPPKIGDVIIFNAGSGYPIIHRIVSENPLQTKGDNNLDQLTILNNPNRVDETNINQNQLIGKAIFKIPRLGWIKLIFVKVYELLSGIPQEPWC